MKRSFGLIFGFLLAGCASTVPPPESPREPPSATSPPGAAESKQTWTDQAWLDASFTVGWFPIAHRFPLEQQVHTPVPVYFEPARSVEVKKATIRFKPFGAINYKSADMKRYGEGFAYEIPCSEVTTTGDLKYFIDLVGSDGQPLDSIGSKREPLRVAIKNEIEAAPPSLPNQKPPAQCLSTCDGFPRQGGRSWE